MSSTPIAPSRPGREADPRADPLAPEETGQVALDRHVEHDDRERVLLAHGDRGPVHDLEAALVDLVEGHRLEALRLLVALGVLVVDPIDLRRLEKRLRADLGAAQ